MEKLRTLLFDPAGDIEEPTVLSRDPDACLNMTNERIHQEATEAEQALAAKERWFLSLEQAIDGVMQEAFGAAGPAAPGAAEGRPEGKEEDP